MEFTPPLGAAKPSAPTRSLEAPDLGVTEPVPAAPVSAPLAWLREPGKPYAVPSYMADAQEEDKRQKLLQAQNESAGLPAPDQAAKLRSDAQARGLPFTAVMGDPKSVEPVRGLPVTWDQYATNEPLSDVLLDPNKSPLVADEADRLARLAGFDKNLPSTNRAVNAIQTGALGLEESHLWTKKGMNGGVLSPEDDARLKQIEASLQYRPQPKGMLDEALGMLPMIGGNVAAGALGAVAGSPLGPLGAGLGARGGALLFNADLMIGQNYSQYTKMGMPHDVAWPAAVISGAIASGIDTVTFGLLAKIPALKLLGKVPGVEALNKTNIGPAMAAALKDSKFVQVLSSLGKDAATGATGNVLMEAVGLLGAYAANATQGGKYNTPSAGEAAARLFHAAELGGVVGAGFGGASTLFHETLGKVRAAEGSQPIVDHIYDVTEGMKSSERAPDVVAEYGNRLAKDSSVKYLTLPVEELTKILDQNAEAPAVKEWLARPENRAKLDEAAKLGTRVEVPVGDFVAYIRPLDKARTLAQSIGVNDGMSTVEAKALKPKIDKAKKEIADLEKKQKDLENLPESQIQTDLEQKLRQVGQTKEASRLQAQLVTTAVATLARRAGQDPWEVYRSAPLTISKVAHERMGSKSLEQADPKGVQKAQGGSPHNGFLKYEHPESPLQLAVYDSGVLSEEHSGKPTRVAGNLGFSNGVPETPDNLKLFGGKGYSTALYLRALMDAQKAGTAWASDTTRTKATAEMYARLQSLGLPFKLEKVDAERTNSGDYFYLSAEDLKKANLDAAWAKLTDKAELRKEMATATDAEIEKVVGNLKELQQNQKGEVRGRITFDPTTRDWFHVTLNEGKANLSTFLHESSHYLLEIMRKLDGETSKFGEDLRVLEEWAGVKPGEEWSDAALEKFARGMETYFGEGKAPSAKLASAFANFKAWILHVYKTLANLGAPLTDEVRGVMDRMLATNEEIDARKLELGYFPNELVVKHGDMTPEQQQAYRGLYEKGAAQAQAKLDRETIAAFRREKSADYRRVTEEVNRSLDKYPVLSLRSFLEGKGRTDEGLVPEHVGKLDAEALKAMRLEPGIVSRLKDLITDRGGVDPDEIAPYFGYKSGAEMVTDLARTPARSTLKSSIVKSEFQKLYPAYGPDPAWLEKTALEQLHGADAIANALEIELRVLYKKADMLPPNSPALVAREAARSQTAQTLVADMRPEKYREAEGRFLREQQKALAAKDFPAAAEAARKRIYNRAMWQEVQKATDAIESAKTYVERFVGEDAQARLGRSSGVLLPTGERLGSVIRDATKALLEGTGFAEESAVSRESTFDAHLSKLEDAGMPVSVDPVLRERPLQTWENLTYMEAMAVKDAMKNLSKIARGQNDIRLGDKAFHLDEVAEKVRAELEANGLLDRLGDAGEKSSTWRRLRSETTKPETIALDIGETFHKFFIGTMEEGQYEKDRRFRLRRDDISAMGKEFRPKDWAKQMKAEHVFDDGRSYTGAEVFAMLLNFGTAANRSKLISGMEKAGRTGWSEESVLKLIHRVFPDRAAYDYADAILKYISRPDLWEDAAKLREAISGVRPEKELAISIPTPDGGSIEGGYYHLLYDRKVPLKEAETVGADALAAMQDANPLNLYAANGFTKGRTGYSAPILLDPTAWAAHLYEVDHFISNAQGIIDRHNLLQHPRIKEAIIHGLGFEYWEQLKNSNNYIAADGQLLTREVLQMSRGIDKLVYHNALLTMGGNILSGINQVVTGVPATITKLGPKGLPVFGKVLVDFVRRPFDMWKQVAEQSGEVKGMEFHFDRDLRLVIAREMTGEKWDHVRARIAATTMTPVVFGQKMVNILTFETARRLAESEGKGKTEQTAYANSIVRQTQSASAPMDHTAVQRSKDGLMRIMTSLASYTFSLNDMVMPRRLTQKEIVGGVSRLVMLTMTTAMAKALFDVVTPKLEEKDAERRKGISKMAEDQDMLGLVPLTESLMSVLGNVPVVGRPVESLLTGREPRFASWVNTATTAAKAGYHLASDKELGKTEMKAIVESIGLIYGVPTRHLMFGPGEFAYEVMNGNVSGGPLDFAQEGLLVRPGQKGDSHAKHR